MDMFEKWSLLWDFIWKFYFLIDCVIVLDCELFYFIFWERLQNVIDCAIVLLLPCWLCNCAIVTMLIVRLCNCYHVDCAIVIESCKVCILIVRLCKKFYSDCAIVWKYAFWLCDCVKICNLIVRLCNCAWLCWLCVIVWFTLSRFFLTNWILL